MTMDIDLYTYNDQLWSICPTMPDNDSFFHSALGVRVNEGEYFNKHAQFRRMRWATFLTYYKNEIMPQSLEDSLTNCFSSIDTYRHISMDDTQNLTKYISDIIATERNVIVEEISLLATLENIRIVLLLSTQSDAVIIVEPNADILGSCPIPNVTEDLKEIVVCLRGNTFSRLEPANEDSMTKFYKSMDEMTTFKKKSTVSEQGFSRYRKGGSAGSKGVQYQVSLLTVVLLNAFRNKDEWRLSTKNMEAGKFDDIVLECSVGDTLIQIKHKENKRKIVFEELMSTNSKSYDFSLPKYFLSYLQLKQKFNIKNVIICTNGTVQEKVRFLNRETCIESVLYQDDNYFCYTFSNEILHLLLEHTATYLDKNYNRIDIDRSSITVETAQDFLKHLQFYSDYYSLNRLKVIINKLLTQVKYCNNSHDKISFLEIYPKVMDWFQQKEGIHLNELYAKTMFADIWRDKFSHRLEQYKVSFIRNDLNFDNPSQIFKVTYNDRCLLQTLNIYQALQNDKIKLLFVNSDDDTDFQKMMVNAFGFPLYQYLIITWKETIISMEMCNELRNILKRYPYKKIILLGQNNNILVNQIGLQYINKDIYLTFKDLSSASQKQLLNKKGIAFQGNNFSLKSLLGTKSIDYYNEIITSEVLEKVVTGEEIKVGSAVQPLHKQMECYYIPREFTREIEDEKSDETRKETYSEENIYKANDKFIIIENRGGMGKSTVLTNLAAAIKQKYPHLWVIRIEFDKYKDILKEFLKKGKAIGVNELMDFHDTTELKTEFERFVFSLDKKVVLILDAVDEISEEINPYLKLIVSLFRQCLNASNIAKVFVASREHAIQALTEELDVTPFKLLPFKEQDYIEFFVKFWTSKLSLTETDISKCRTYAQAVVNNMRRWINPERAARQRLVIVPLQLKMLAEIFQESNRFEAESWDGCKEFLTADEPEPNLPKRIHIAKLFMELIEKKGDFLIDETDSSDRKADKQMLIKKYKEYLAYRKML